MPIKQTDEYITIDYLFDYYLFYYGITLPTAMLKEVTKGNATFQDAIIYTVLINDFVARENNIFDDEEIDNEHYIIVPYKKLSYILNTTKRKINISLKKLVEIEYAKVIFYRDYFKVNIIKDKIRGRLEDFNVVKSGD